MWFGGESDDVTRDKEMQELLTKGNNSVDPKVRQQAYQQALKLIADNAYSVPLWSLPVYYVGEQGPELHGLPGRDGPLLGDDLEVTASVD